MNGHDRNMLWQVHRAQSTSMVLLLVILSTVTEVVSATAPCTENSCSKTFPKGVKQAKFLNKITADLIKTYQANQGDFAEQFCKMPMDNVPDSTLSGQTPPERVLNIYTRLKEFLPHLKKVLDQQRDLQPPSSPLLPDLSDLKEHTAHLAHKVNCIFQILQPNIPLPEPPARPTGIPPAQNVFQQKVYGCVVLTRLGEFLSRVVSELRSLRGNMCRKRTRKILHNF